MKNLIFQKEQGNLQFYVKKQKFKKNLKKFKKN
jgi:hypothetical protein